MDIVVGRIADLSGRSFGWQKSAPIADIPVHLLSGCPRRKGVKPVHGWDASRRDSSARKCDRFSPAVLSQRED
jgi:hypothetical protein